MAPLLHFVNGRSHIAVTPCSHIAAPYAVTANFRHLW